MQAHDQAQKDYQEKFIDKYQMDIKYMHELIVGVSSQL